MSLSVEQVRQMREQIKANDAAKTAAQKKKTTTQTAKTTPAAPAAKSAGTGLSVAQVAQIRSQMTAAPASTSRLQTTASTPAWTGGTRQVLGTVSADTLGKQVLAVVNFPPRQIADFFSQVLVLGTYSQGGVVLITPDKPVENGDRLG